MMASKTTHGQFWHFASADGRYIVEIRYSYDFEYRCWLDGGIGIVRAHHRKADAWRDYLGEWHCKRPVPREVKRWAVRKMKAYWPKADRG